MGFVLQTYHKTTSMVAFKSTEHMREASRVLNILYVYDRTYEPYLVHWLFPLQIAFQNSSEKTTEKGKWWVFLEWKGWFILEILRSYLTFEEYALHVDCKLSTSTDSDCSKFYIFTLYFSKSCCWKHHVQYFNPTEYSLTLTSSLSALLSSFNISEIYNVTVKPV